MSEKIQRTSGEKRENLSTQSEAILNEANFLFPNFDSEKQEEVF